MRQDPEETGSETRAVPGGGRRPERVRLRSRGHSFGHQGHRAERPREKGRNLDRIGAGTKAGGGAQRGVGGAPEERGARRAGAGPGEDGAGPGEDGAGPGSLFWQAGGAALQDRSHWQVRMSEPSSS